jgi:ActR/RegA family two-component response regulator
MLDRMGIEANRGGAPPRLAILDGDSGFVQVLGKRLERLGWEHRVLAGRITPEALSAMRVSAVVVDLTVLGDEPWEWLERTAAALPGLGLVVCTGPSTVAQRVRGLRPGAHDGLRTP